MSKAKSLLAIMMAMLLCIGVFAGCSTATTNNNNGSNNDSDTTQNNQSDTSDDDTLTDEVADVIGEVTYVGTSYLSVTTYESESEVTDYATLDTDTLTETGSTQYVYPDDAATYHKVSEGAIVDATADEVVAGCLIAVTTDDDGNQQIIILKTADETAEDNEDETTGTEEDADIIAEVTAVNDDGTLELTIFDVVDDTLEITDYADVDLVNYTASETTETYTIADETVIAVVEEGVLTETTSDEIVTGDMLVIYIDDEGVTNIAVYHTKEESAA